MNFTTYKTNTKHTRYLSKEQHIRNPDQDLSEILKMGEVIEETPVHIRLNCNEPECHKTFKNKGNIEKHTGRFHKIGSALSSSPLATSVRTLFLGENSEDTDSPSIQGNSDGLVNVQAVVSEADFLCGQCNKKFETNTQARNHMNDKHDKAVVAETNNVSDDTETNDV